MGKPKSLCCKLLIRTGILSLALLGACAARQGAVPPASEVQAPAVDPATGIEFVRIPGGTFEMGDTSGGSPWRNEGPVRTVTVSGFWLGKTEVTQAQWETVMGNNPSRFKAADRPVEQVSWDDVQQFVARLNQKTGRAYRLPTEAEWEYAARSGGKNEQWAGTSHPERLGDVAWYRGNSGRETQPVGRRQPNGLGLHDMSGNVWEWCQDLYGERQSPLGPTTDPAGPNAGSSRVMRGGSWDDEPALLRNSGRLGSAPTWRREAIGFRLVLPRSD